MANKPETDPLWHTIEEEFIPNDFISEVEARPAIWNQADVKYSRHACRKAAWDSLIQKYHPDFLTRSAADQALIGSHYRRKWKSFRDSFARELSKIKNSAKPRKTKYIYFQQLSFLLSMRGVPSSNIDDVESYLFYSKNGQFDDDDSNNDTTNNTAANDNNPLNNSSFIKSEPDFSLFEVQRCDLSDNQKQCTDVPPLSEQPHNKLKRHKSSSSDVSAYVLDEDDEDKLFLLSLLSELRRVPTDMKLDVKCDLLNVFKHARNQYMNNNNNNNDDDNNNIINDDNNIDNNIDNIINNNNNDNNVINDNNDNNDDNQIIENHNIISNNSNNNNIINNNNNAYHSFNGYNNHHNNIFNNLNGDDGIDAYDTNILDNNNNNNNDNNNNNNNNNDFSHT